MDILHPVDKPLGAVLIIHSWWGLTESFRAYGSSLAEAGYLVGLTDLFDGRVAQEAAQAKKLRARPRKVPMYKVLSADLHALRHAGGSAELKIGIVGFSMGGHWAIWLSQRPEYGIAGTVLYYAARGGSFEECEADIQAHFAEQDEWVSRQSRKTMENAIRKSECTYVSYDYPGTTHWFAESDRSAEYDQTNANLALKRDLNFFGSTLTAR